MSNDFQSLAHEVGYTQAETVMAPVRSRDALAPTVTKLLAPLKDSARRNFAWVERVVFARLPWLPLQQFSFWQSPCFWLCWGQWIEAFQHEIHQRFPTVEAPVTG